MEMLPFRRDVAAAEYVSSAAITYGSLTSPHGGETSSDFCVRERCRRGGFTLAIGSVSSIGAGSERTAHALRRAFRMAAVSQARPSSILDGLERIASLNGPARSSASLFVAAVGSGTGLLTYAATGSGGALVYRDVRRHEHLDFARTSTDVRKHLSSVQRTIAFPPGSVLVAYTDGLARASAKVDGRPLGSAGLSRIVHRVLQVSAAPVCSTLWQEIDRFTGGAYRYDATLALIIALER